LRLREHLVCEFHQGFPCFAVHNVRFLGWYRAVTGFNSGGTGIRSS
jgi:hypothetical protein